MYMYRCKIMLQNLTSVHQCRQKGEKWRGGYVSQDVLTEENDSTSGV